MVIPAGPTSPLTRISIRIPPIDYTSRDFQAISDDMLRTIPFFAPEWTDHNLSDFGIVLQRLVSFTTDVLHFYIDRMANEAFLPTAITRRSVINLLKLIDFKLRSAVAATVDLKFIVESSVAGNFEGNFELLIPAGTQVQSTVDATEIPIFFETAVDGVIRFDPDNPTAVLEVTIPAREGRTVGRTPDEELIGISNGLPRQRFSLLKTPVLDGSIKIFVDEGIELRWTEVESFIVSGGDDLHYVTERDEDGEVEVFFGDNAAGKIADPGATIRGEYRIGGGIVGNVAADTITVINRTFTFNGSPVQVSVTNPAAASGGEDEMSLEEAKKLGPQSLKALNRAVTESDFVTLAELVPGVAKAAVSVGTPDCIDKNSVAKISAITQVDCLSDAQKKQLFDRFNVFLGTLESTIGCCCVVTVFIAPRGGGPPSSLLKEDVLECLNERKLAGTCINIGEPEYAPIDIEGTVFVADNFALDEIMSNTDQAITQYFDLTSDFVGFGQNLFLSDFFHLVDAIPGVDHVDLVEISRRAIPSLEVWSGACEFDPINTADPVTPKRVIKYGDNVKEEIWTIIYTSATTFTVRGTKSGPQTRIGEVGVEYTSDNGEITFIVKCTAGGEPPKAGDRATFDTSLKKENVPIGTGQIMQRGEVKLTFIGGARPQRVCPS